MATPPSIVGPHAYVRMLHVSALGEISIETETLRLTPAAPLNFALALVLVLERPRLLSRDRLESVLFSESTAKSASHCLRQTVYKLRRAGFPLESVPDGIRLTSEAVDDYSGYLADAPDLTLPISALDGGFLPNYSPDIASGFADWLEEQRSRVNLGLRRFLLRAAAAAKAAGDLPRMEQCARSCLTIDPLNEEATLTLAECLVLAGSKAEALKLLDEYEKSVGGSDALKIAPALLRRRVSGTTANSAAERAGGLLGRTREIAGILERARRAANRNGCGILLQAARGMGRSRLLEESAAALRVRGFRTVTWTCPRQQVRQPLGDILNLLGLVRELPGALGASPESLSTLASLSRASGRPFPAISIETVATAALDVLSGVCAEAPLAIVVDDAHLADPLSASVLSELTRRATTLPFLVVTSECTRRPPVSSESVIELTPLSDSDAAALCRVILPPGTPDHVIEYVTANGHGVPADLVALATEYKRTNRMTLPSELAEVWQNEIDALGADERLILEAIAMLAAHAEYDRVQAITGISRTRFLHAVRGVEGRRLAIAVRDVLSIANPLLAEVVVARTPAGIRSFLNKRAGEALMRAANRSGDFALSWCAIDHFRTAGCLATVPDAVIACAEQAMHLGRAIEARALVAEALACCSSLQDRAKLLECLAEACYSSGDWKAALEALEAVPKDRKSLRAMRIVRDSTRQEGLSVSTLSLSRPKPTRDFDELARIDEITSEFLHAEQMLDDARAHACYQEALPLMDRHHGSAAATRLFVFYNTLYGDRLAALARAQAALELVDTPAERKRPLHSWCPIGSCLSLLGDPDAALDLFDRLLHRSTSQRLREQTLFVWISRVAVYLEHDRTEEAMSAHTRCVALAEEFGGEQHSLGFAGNALAIAIARRALPDARNRLLSIRSRWPLTAEGRTKVVMAAFEATIAQKAGDPCSDDGLAVLQCGARALQQRHFCDEAIEGLLRAYVSRGRRTDAEAAASRYFRTVRDPAAPILPRTLRTLKEIGLSELCDAPLGCASTTKQASA